MRGNGTTWALRRTRPGGPKRAHGRWRGARTFIPSGPNENFQTRLTTNATAWSVPDFLRPTAIAQLFPYSTRATSRSAPCWRQPQQGIHVRTLRQRIISSARTLPDCGPGAIACALRRSIARLERPAAHALGILRNGLRRMTHPSLHGRLGLERREHGSVPRHFDGSEDPVRKALHRGNPHRCCGGSRRACLGRFDRGPDVRASADSRANFRGSPLRGARGRAPASCRQQLG